LFPEDKTNKVTFEGTPASGDFSTTITDLQSNTPYYFCLYASTGSTVVTSDFGSFSTVSTSKPSFSTITVDSIGDNTAILRFRILEIGDEYLVEQGIAYRKRANGTNTESFVPVPSSYASNASLREYVTILTDLSAETTYEIRPYAKNSADANGNSGMLEGYGETQTITTERQLAPTVKTDLIESGNIGATSAIVSGHVVSADASNGIVDEIGFCYSEDNTTPTWLDNAIRINGTSLNTTYSTTLTGLKQNTTYFVRMYAKNTVDGTSLYGYGEVREFTTSQLSTPIFDYIYVNSVSSTSINVSATLSNYDAKSIKERGFYWATSYEECTLDKAAQLGHVIKVTDGGRVFTTDITGLNLNTLYYIGAYAINESEGEELTGYSDICNATTNGLEDASLDNPVVSNITTNGATVTGVIRNAGNGEITERGFVLSNRSDKLTIETGDQAVVANANFQYDFSNLSASTIYYVTSYVKCSLAGVEKTIYSGYTLFTTDDEEEKTSDTPSIDDILSPDKKL
jgi:hypothetical protein